MKKSNDKQTMSRRCAMRLGGVAAALAPAGFRERGVAADAPEAFIGITTSSIDAHLGTTSAGGRIAIMDLPRVMRDELGMRVIDLNTNTLAKAGKRIAAFRIEAEKAGCVITNLKMNQRGLDMNSPHEDVRNKALDVYRKSIDDAAKAGAKWARPLPLPQTPDLAIHADSYRRLADHAEKRGVRMLVENYGWMQGDPDSIPDLIKRIDRDVAASPDTGNWNSDELRWEGLRRSFPLAVTCDFKAKTLDQDGGHAAYDLRRCFEIGREAGFRGPWCLEHAHRDRGKLFKELVLLRNMLAGWM